MGHVEAGRGAAVGGGFGGRTEMRLGVGGAEGAMSESPYVVSYKVRLLGAVVW